jgi:hypothetical protein
MEEGPSSHTDWIAMVANAYYSRHCEDIARLLVGIQPPYKLFGDEPEPLSVRIDSAEMDGFLRFFQDDHCMLDCNQCDYCGNWARRAVRVNGRPMECAQALANDLQTIRVGSYRSGR